MHSLTADAFDARLRARAAAAGLSVEPETIVKLREYFGLLARWNARINLTALPLRSPTSRTFDRLFIEPLAASTALAGLPGTRWFDLGSGGGSPAVPLAIARPELRLTMVEVRQKKAAFLREVARTLGLNADVEDRRYEEVADASAGLAALVTSRAVRTTPEFWQAVQRLLQPGGVVAIFGGERTADAGDEIEWFPNVKLAAEPGSWLLRGRYVPRGT